MNGGARRTPGRTRTPGHALRWLLAPLWLAQVFSAAKRCDLNPILGDMALNRQGLHVWRARLAHRMTERRRRRLAGRVEAADRAAFERDGLVVRSGFVPPDLFRAIKAEIEAYRGDAWETREGAAITRTYALTPRTLKRLPACREVLTGKPWRHLLAYVASFDAHASAFLQVVFSQAAPGKPDPQTALHMDTFHPTMKAWLFLHEVGEADGPFAYVPGSHRRSPRRDAWERRMSVEAADPSTPSRGGSFRLGADELRRLRHAAPTRVTVEPNTLVVADTCGFHARAASAQPTTRLAIYASCRRNPFRPWIAPNWRTPALLEDGWWAMQGWLASRRQDPRERGGQVRLVRQVSPRTPPQSWPG